MHILNIFTSGHFFSPNNKKWFRLFHNYEDIKVSIMIQEPHEDIKEKFHNQYGNYFNVLYFQNKDALLKKHYIKRFFYLKYFARRIDEINPDIIHIHGLYFTYLVLPLLFIKCKPKIVINVWGSDFNIAFQNKLKNRILLKWLFKKSHLIWANWLAMADNIRSKFPKYNNKIRTIPLGVNDDLFLKSNEIDRKSIIEKFDIKQEEYLILYTRGFVMNSNYHKIIEALGKIDTAIPYKVIFQHFKHNRDMDEYLFKLINKYDLQDKVVISHSELSDGEMKALYELADLTFSVTTKEQFSRTIHEAILTDTNLILNDIEPYQYLKYFFNWNVELVNINNTEKLAQKIEQFITKKPLPNWEYEKTIVQKVFRFENKENLFKTIYEDLINE
ncbi:MAG: glycosyltransferase [Candidatus Woesearchaeota archaeon]